MKSRAHRIVVGLAVCTLSACATTPKGPPAPFLVRTTPAGAAVETTFGYRCTSPCQIPLGPAAFVATVTSVGYKPVQIPVAAGRSPGTVDVKLQPQDPGAGAPNPAGAK